MGECKIEQDMSMTEYEKIDFIRFSKFFGKAYQVLVFLALIFGVVISGFSTVGRPPQCKSNGPPGVFFRRYLHARGRNVFPQFRLSRFRRVS